jgi:cobaltochelatase CobS subunit
MNPSTDAVGLTAKPDISLAVRQTFGIDSDMKVPAYSERNDHVPDVDETYRFDRDTTLAILAGFAYNRRVMIQGYHGTGKSTHIEQVAARLNWPCIRINLDSHISRIDLIGKPIVNSGPIPTKTALSETLSAALKKRGFKFVGPVIVYAWMQAVGIVDDHAPHCFRRMA